jgi:hypothetical protein
LKKEKPTLSPEGELADLVRGKGQTLTGSALRSIKESLELRGVSVAEFAADVRPHFRNNLLNPIGFLIDRARRFHELSRPAIARTAPSSERAAEPNDCRRCSGQRLMLIRNRIEPCPDCSTLEFQMEWEAKEADRARRVQRRDY